MSGKYAQHNAGNDSSSGGDFIAPDQSDGTTAALDFDMEKFKDSPGKATGSGQAITTESINTVTKSGEANNSVISAPGLSTAASSNTIVVSETVNNIATTATQESTEVKAIVQTVTAMMALEATTAYSTAAESGINLNFNHLYEFNSDEVVDTQTQPLQSTVRQSRQGDSRDSPSDHSNNLQHYENLNFDFNFNMFGVSGVEGVSLQEMGFGMEGVMKGEMMGTMPEGIIEQRLIDGEIDLGSERGQNLREELAFKLNVFTFTLESSFANAVFDFGGGFGGNGLGLDSAYGDYANDIANMVVDQIFNSIMETGFNDYAFLPAGNLFDIGDLVQNTWFLTSGDDRFVTGLGADKFVTTNDNFGADDVIWANGGVDTIVFTDLLLYPATSFFLKKTGIDVLQFDANLSQVQLSDAFVGASDNDSVLLNNGTNTLLLKTAEVTDTNNFVFIGGTGWVNLSDDGDNIVYSQAGVDVRIAGGSGVDKIYGGTGNDTLRGNDGNDSIWLDKGNDTVTGGNGDDTIQVRGNWLTADDSIDGGAGTDSLVLTHNTTLTLTSDYTLDNLESIVVADTWDYTLTLAASYNDTRVIDGSQLTSGNTLTADASAQTGAATLTGGADVDTLTGGSGDDTIDGGAGADVLSGNAGDDTFVYDSADLVGTSLKIDGGANTATLGSGDSYSFTNISGQTLDLTTLNDNVIQNIEIFDLTGSGDNTLTLSVSDVLATSSATDALFVEGNAGDTVNIDDDASWTLGDDQDVGGNTYKYYYSTDAGDDAEIYIDDAITIS